MRSKILAVTAAVLALGHDCSLRRRRRRRRAPRRARPAPSRSGCRTTPRRSPGASRWWPTGTTAHPDEKVTAQEIPAGKTSEEVIGAAITAGNAPCLVFNTSPAAVPQFQKQGGLVALDSFKGAADYIEARSGASAEQYKSPDGKFYQIPWKSEPGDDLLQQGALQEGRPRPGQSPPLATYDEFLATSKKIVDSGAATAAICAGADERVLPVLVRLLPALRRARPAASSSSRTARRPSTTRPARPSGTSGRTMYTEQLRAQGDLQR